MTVTQFPNSDEHTVEPVKGLPAHFVLPARANRDLSFNLLATGILSAIGFASLATGLNHLLNGNVLLAISLAVCIQGLAVSAVHSYKRARTSGSSFSLFRGGKSLALYGVLIVMMICSSYSFWYRLLRAQEAAGETFAEQKQIILSKLTKIESSYKGISEGFSGLADSATARAKEEKDNGNTCRIASPKGPGPIQQFRVRDSQQFRDYANQVATKVKEISARSDLVRARVLGHDSEVRSTEAALNEVVEQINSGLIGNPLLPGVVQFIDARLLAADAIEYFGRTVKCDDEQRNVQLVTLKATASAIISESLLTRMKLLDPDSTYDNTILGANRIAALVEWVNPFTNTKLADLDPAVSRVKLSGGLKVYVAPDYLPLFFAALIDALLFFVVPLPRQDLGKREFVNSLVRREIPFLNGRSLLWLFWLYVTVPVKEEDTHEPTGNISLDLPPKFVRLRPYLYPHHGRRFLVIPHALEMASVHDCADALMLKGHAKSLVEDSLTIDTLPSETWSKQLSEIVIRVATVQGIEQRIEHGQMPVRVLEVSRDFHAWLIGQIVALPENELTPDPSPKWPAK